MRNLALAVCMAVVACSPSEKGEGAEGSLTFEERTWGKPTERITISEEGRLKHEVWNPTELKSEKSFDLTAAQHQKAINLLVDLRSRSGSSISCNNRVTDGPYASIVWDEVETLHIYLPCLSNPELASSEAALLSFREYVSEIQSSSQGDM